MKLPSNVKPTPTCSVCESKLYKNWGKWNCPNAFNHEAYTVVKGKSDYQKAQEEKFNLKD